jgi:hypothetical protein
MFISKKGIVSVSMFSLIIVASLLVLTFSVYFYDLNKERSNQYNLRIELINSINTLRSELVSLIPYTNSSLLYNSTLDSDSLILELNRNYIYGQEFIDGTKSQVNISTTGFLFCESYTYYPASLGNFSYNGSCMSLT